MTKYNLRRVAFFFFLSLTSLFLLSFSSYAEKFDYKSSENGSLGYYERINKIEKYLEKLSQMKSTISNSLMQKVDNISEAMRIDNRSRFDIINDELSKIKSKNEMKSEIIALKKKVEKLEIIIKGHGEEILKNRNLLSKISKKLKDEGK